MSVTAGGASPSPSATLSPDQMAIVQQFMQGGGTTAATGGYPSTGIQGRVYWGQAPRMVGGSAAAAAQDIPKFITPDEAMKEFDTWDEKRLADFEAQARVGGLMGPNDGELQARQLWGNLVQDAAAKGAAGNRVTPFDILSSYVKNAGSSGVWVDDGNHFQRNTITGARRYVGPQFQTTSQTSTDLTDPETARALTASIFQQMLGRDPMPGELNAYAAALNAAEQAAPTTTTTTTEYDSQGNAVGTSSTSSGGLGAQGAQYLLEQRAKGTKEYGATQAATTYTNAFEQAVWGGH